MQSVSLDNRKLVMLLNDMIKKQNPDVMEEIFRIIAEDSYFLMGVQFNKKPILQKDGSYFIQDDTDISFPVLINEQREKYYPIFTDYAEIQKWSIDFNKTTIITACIDDFVDIFDNDPEGKGIVLNPFSQSFVIYKEMVEKMFETRKINKPNDKRVLAFHHKLSKK